MTNQESPYAIGALVECADGACGDLVRVIVNPVSRTLTHLVVGAKHDTARLVPASLVADANSERIRLQCTTEQFNQLEAAETAEFLPATRSELGYPAERVQWLPYYPLGPLGVGVVDAGMADPVVYERVPAGDVQIRRGESVHALDGDIGHVAGLVVDADNQVTHVLLAEGHLWNKKEVAIPVKSVSEVAGGVHLLLTKDQIRDLPPVEIGELG